jgi:transcriptional regulator with XRE-family HTH domain
MFSHRCINQVVDRNFTVAGFHNGLNVLGLSNPLFAVGVAAQGSLGNTGKLGKLIEPDSSLLTVGKNIHKPIIDTNEMQMQVKSHPKFQALIERAKKFLSDENLNEGDLARMVGVSEPTIWRILNSKTKKPHQSTMTAIEKAIAPIQQNQSTGEPVLDKNSIWEEMYKLKDRIDKLEKQLGGGNVTGQRRKPPVT